MKLAVTSVGPDLSSQMDQRFGRARYLVIVDSPEGTATALDNRLAQNAAEGAGIQAAQNVIDSKATALITGHCGPKAFRALQAAGIEVYKAEEGTVAEAVAQFEAGKLQKLAGADVNSHW